MSETRVMIAGFGGQGILFAGKVIAYAGLVEDREVTWMPSYGPEMRGGTACCGVTLSDEPVGSPLIVEPTILIAMNRPSLDKYEQTVVPGGVILVDTTLVDRMPTREDVCVLTVDATRIAEENGLKGLANIVLVGKLLESTAFCTEEALEDGIRKAVPASKAAMIEKNLLAVKIGRAS